MQLGMGVPKTFQFHVVNHAFPWKSAFASAVTPRLPGSERTFHAGHQFARRARRSAFAGGKSDRLTRLTGSSNSDRHLDRLARVATVAIKPSTDRSRASRSSPARQSGTSLARGFVATIRERLPDSRTVNPASSRLTRRPTVQIPRSAPASARGPSGKFPELRFISPDVFLQREREPLRMPGTQNQACHQLPLRHARKQINKI